MPGYRIRLSDEASTQIRRLDKPMRRRIEARLIALADNPRPAQARKLVSRPGIRIRVGDYRIVYDVQDDVLVVLVLEVGHRSRIYD